MAGNDTIRSVVGWQPNSDRRGTLAILESCIFTILACTWTILHLNVPGPSDSAFRILRRKMALAIITVFLPEIILAHAMMERSAAILSLQELKALDIEDLEVCYDPWSWARLWGAVRKWLKKRLCCCSTDHLEAGARPSQNELDTGSPRKKWTLRHSYYANMGGLRLVLEDGGVICSFTIAAFTSIALTTRQFGYLREKGVITSTPNILEGEIEDKAKTDYFTKGIAIVQIFWLILSLCGRASRHLAVSQLEILTVAFAACAAVTYFFAWDKPQGVNTGTKVHATAPLNIVDTNRIAQLQPKALNILLFGATDIREGPQFERIHNDTIELSNSYTQPVSLWLTVSIMLFGAIHLSAWNYTFPTPTERVLWRTASVVITALPVFFMFNMFISSVLHQVEEEIEDYQTSIVSLWEDYIAARRADGCPEWELPVPHRLADRKPVAFYEIEQYLSRWTDENRNFPLLRTYIADQSQDTEGQTRVRNFEFFLTQLPKYRKADVLGVSPFDHKKYTQKKWDLVQWLRQQRHHESLTMSEKIAAYVEKRNFAGTTYLVAGSLYVVFRFLLILLAFIGLRAMPDSVYETTWAKNIPSVQ